ncbi:hypothetical protein BC834DRAFT_974120 [Gloeopeniophorella convolvens]|nr:hypothetical protein BC834DRAFT_974120 [Gloeopeniophorella convolvens]
MRRVCKDTQKGMQDIVPTLFTAIGLSDLLVFVTVPVAEGRATGVQTTHPKLVPVSVDSHTMGGGTPQDSRIEGGVPRPSCTDAMGGSRHCLRSWRGIGMLLRVFWELAALSVCAFHSNFEPEETTFVYAEDSPS